MLISVIFKNSKRLEKNNKSTKRESILSILSFIIVFAFLAAIMIGVSVYVTSKLADIDQTYAFVNILLLMNFILLFAKSIFESLNVLYFSKDLKILLRMPIKSKDIVNAKLLNMIVSEYEMELIMLAIPMVVYGIFTGVNAIFYLYTAIILLVLPVIPISITSLIVAIIMRFTNSIKNKSKVMYVTIIMAMFIVSLVSAVFQSDVDLSTSTFETIILETNGLAETISDFFVLIKPIMNTLLNYGNINGLKNLILFVGESALCYVAVVFLMSKIYLKGAIGTTINSSKGKASLNKEIKLQDFKEKNKNKAYLFKEWKVLSRTPIFLIQCLIMPIAYPILVFLIVAFFDRFALQIGLDLVAEVNEKLQQTSGQAIFLAIGQVLYMLNFCSIIAVSKDSKNAIITKYIPIKLTRQFNLKISIGVIGNFISIIFVTVCYYICTKSMIYTFLSFVILIFMNLICEKIKLLIDLRNPQISWDNEYTMMKQNTNVLYELFYTLLILGILLFVSLFVKNVILYLILIVALNIIINTAINEHIYNKQIIIFKKVF